METEIIDVHAGIGEGRPEESRSVETALREMDEAGVAQAWIYPPEGCVAVRNREGNDFIASAVRQYPGRFIGCAVANPWHGAAAVEELRRAFGRGLRVLYLGTHLQGVHLNDPMLDLLIREAVEHRAPIYAHTGTPVYAMPFQLAFLARRHPDAAFLLGHMGFPDFWTDGVPAAAMAGNILLETSLVGTELISEAIQGVGAERVVFGSSIPLSHYMPELNKLRALEVSEGVLAGILARNARRLLP